MKAAAGLETLVTRRERASPALVSPEEGAMLTYGALAAAVEQLAARLAAIGVGRGDRVALVLPNGPEFLEVLLAITALGAAAAPLNPAYTHDEYAFYLEDLAPRVLLVPAGGLEAARAAADPATGIVDVLAGSEGPPGLAVDGRPVEQEIPFEPGGADDVALLLHTSGTTSRPKQVPLLQGNLTASAGTIAEHYRLGEQDVSYVAMPLFHVHGLVASVLAALSAGGSVVVPRRFAPGRFWAQARAHGITWFSAGPTLHQMILEKADGPGPPASLRFVRSCSSALSPALMQRAEEAFGVPMLEAYGMTEASHQMTSNPLPPEPRYAGSVGIPTGTDVRIVDPGGRELADRAPGEVAIRGPAVTPGYLNNEQANEEAFVDGWFRTGDRGVFEGGYLRLEGRLKEMILRGGENISPYEIEEVLLGHPAVVDAVCFGVEDEKYGERVAAAVALSGEAEERELIGHCRERLAAFKVPETIHLLERIPRTPTGKVQRRRMASLLEAQR